MSTFKQLFDSYELIELEKNDINIRTHRIIKALQEIHNGFYLSMVVVLEGDINEDILKDRFCEDFNENYKISALNFIKQINEIIINSNLD